MQLLTCGVFWPTPHERLTKAMNHLEAHIPNRTLTFESGYWTPAVSENV